MLYDHKRHLYNTIDDIQLYKVKEYRCGHLIPDKLLCRRHGDNRSPFLCYIWNILMDLLLHFLLI